MPRPFTSPPDGVPTSTVRYRVPFFDTDAMGVVHHANYVRYLELGRIRLLEEHDQPYTYFVELGLHFAVIRCEVDYRQASRFDDTLDITCWLASISGAQLAISYVIHRDDTLIATGLTEHAMVDLDGRVRRIPKERRQALAKLSAS